MYRKTILLELSYNTQFMELTVLIQLCVEVVLEDEKTKEQDFLFEDGTITVYI